MKDFWDALDSKEIFGFVGLLSRNRKARKSRELKLGIGLSSF